MFRLRRMRRPASCRCSRRHAAQLGVVQDQIGQLAPLLHQVDVGQPRHLLREAAHAEDLAEDVAGVVEAEGLVEVARQQVLLHLFKLGRPRPHVKLIVLIHIMR